MFCCEFKLAIEQQKSPVQKNFKLVPLSPPHPIAKPSPHRDTRFEPRHEVPPWHSILLASDRKALPNVRRPRLGAH